MNKYTGWDCTTSDGIARRTLDASLTPEVFFKEYVQPRRPVLLVLPKGSKKGTAAQEDSTTSFTATAFGASFAKWTPAYLRSKCADAPVRVEQRSTTTPQNSGPGKFGQGVRTTMAFGEFVDRSESGDTNLYLTTQDLAEDDQGRPLLMSEPCSSLYQAGDFVARPPLAGNLVPMNLNLWWGRALANQESSSGLHHDFHDNLYVLLSGRKRFLLISPKHALKLETVGDIKLVHPNGRINYAGQPNTFADGSDASARRELEAQEQLREAEQELAVAEANGDEEAMARAEAKIDAALESALAAEMNNDGESGNDEEEHYFTKADLADVGSEEDDDFDEGEFDEDDDGENEKDNENDEDDEEEEEYVIGNGGGKDSSSSSGSSRSSSDRGRHVFKRPRSSEEGTNLEGKKEDSAKKSTKATATPNNFSTIENLATHVWNTKPDKTGNGSSSSSSSSGGKDDTLPPPILECTVEAGEVLYLPAGWFHEVFSSAAPLSPSVSSSLSSSTIITSSHSSSSPPSSSSAPSSAPSTTSGAHMAFNYWFHPPDGESFEKPYTNDFWERDFQKRFNAQK